MTKILIIYTGGTIGMINDPDTGVLTPFNFDRILQYVPELSRLNYDITAHSFDPVIDSSNVNPAIWVQLAQQIEKHYEAFDGFVILHGTDTMAFSASALSFMLEGLGKPVIFTGSQLPIGEIRNDAKENLITALQIAAAKIEDKARVPEVGVYFDFQLYRGNRVIKYSSTKFEAFSSPNYPLLAEAGVHLKFNDRYIRKKSDAKLNVHTALDASIAVLKLYPGIPRSAVEAIVNADVKAIIIETFGSGNAPTEHWFLAMLKKAISNGKIILNISQCRVGTVDLGRYDTSIALKDMGVVSGYDMTFEAAVTKLMFLMGQTSNTSKIGDLLQTDLQGELNKFNPFI